MRAAARLANVVPLSPTCTPPRAHARLHLLPTSNTFKSASSCSTRNRTSNIAHNSSMIAEWYIYNDRHTHVPSITPPLPLLPPPLPLHPPTPTACPAPLKTSPLLKFGELSLRRLQLALLLQKLVREQHSLAKTPVRCHRNHPHCRHSRRRHCRRSSPRRHPN